MINLVNILVYKNLNNIIYDYKFIYNNIKNVNKE